MFRQGPGTRYVPPRTGLVQCSKESRKIEAEDVLHILPVLSANSARGVVIRLAEQALCTYEGPICFVEKLPSVSVQAGPIE
jgi:hypothetical protein